MSKQRLNIIPERLLWNSYGKITQKVFYCLFVCFFFFHDYYIKCEGAFQCVNPSEHKRSHVNM